MAGASLRDGTQLVFCASISRKVIYAQERTSLWTVKEQFFGTKKAPLMLDPSTLRRRFL
jgi:hypothetical protein